MSKSRKFVRLSINSAIAFSCSIVALTATAMADGPARGSLKDAPMVAPFSWTGFYVGVNAGYAWSDSDSNHSGVNNAYVVSAPNFNAAVADKASLSDGGFTGGVQAGYNVQASNIVYGLEADFNWLQAKASRSSVYNVALPANPFTTTDSYEANWLFTLRPRVGVVSGNALFYVTGGLAVTQIKQSHTFIDSIAPQFAESDSSSDTKAGWTIGGGVELALGGNWSMKGEYLYADFGKATSGGTLLNTVTGLSASAPPTTFSHSTDLTLQTVRLGLNYKF